MSDLAALSALRVEAPSEVFRLAFRRFPAGVAIVTAVGPTGPVGVTVTSLRSLSAEPPLLAFSLLRTASTWPAFAAARRFLVHLPGADQADLAARFSTSGIDRFAAPTRWSSARDGLPRLEGAETVLTCEKADQLALGEADLLVGTVLETVHNPATSPLIYHDGEFRLLHERPAPRVRPASPDADATTV